MASPFNMLNPFKMMEEMLGGRMEPGTRAPSTHGEFGLPSPAPHRQQSKKASEELQATDMRGSTWV
jgi:hypothetical protein